MSSNLQFPRTYIFGFLLGDHEKKELEDELDKVGALRYTIQEAEMGLTKIHTKARVKFELRKLKVAMVDVAEVEKQAENLGEMNVEVKEEVGKKRKAANSKREKERKSILNEDGNEVIEISSSGEETENLEEEKRESLKVARKKMKSADGTNSSALIGNENGRDTFKTQDNLKAPTVLIAPDTIEFANTFKVLNVDWYYDSVQKGVLLPMKKYLIYEGRRTMEPPKFLPSDLLIRAAADFEGPVKPNYNQHHRHQRSSSPLTRPTLLTQTTSEHDDPEHFPPLPDYLTTIYSCERATPLHTPNDDFITQLKFIKLKRLLDADPIGIRAYSTSIASIAAYPFPLSSPNEILRLPGCDQKLANLFHQYQTTCHITEALDFQTNPRMQILQLFYNIWGVGEATAREFHDQNGWRDLDDVVEFGWDKLSRVQQIGVKYYDDFLLPIPRAEVEGIGEIVLNEAKKIHEAFQMVIVGGYRRGKTECGDVDIMLTHPDEKCTLGFLPRLTRRLEDAGWITNILQESLANSERGQRAVDISSKGGDEKEGKRKCFDSLDKALVVWQDIRYSLSIPPSQPLSPSQSTLHSSKPPPNPNPHRRVDIIITPWKTAGTAILGWSGDTTFQRDLRKWVKDKRGWRFDSSGIRDRETGRWVDLERGVEGEGVGEGVLREKEGRVLEGCGLVWREPGERCTG